MDTEMKIFNYDSPLMQFFIFLSRLTLLNVVWFLGCLPVVTAGASTAGLYYAADQLRLGGTDVWKFYKTGWLRHWKQATPVWLLFALILFAFSYNYFFLTDERIWGSTVMVVLSVISLVTAVLTALWFFPVMINFRGTIPELFGNAFIFAFMYAPLTLAGAAMYGLLFWLVMRHPVAGGVVIVFAEALIVYITLVIDEFAFKKYRKSGTDQ